MGVTILRPQFLYATMNIEIAEIPPKKELAPYVQTYWYGRFNLNQSRFFTQQVMPNGFVELIFHLSSKHCYLYQRSRWSQSPVFTLIGLFTKPYEVQFDECVKTFGIRFKPEGIYNLFGVPASEFSEDFLDMTCVLSRSFATFSQRILEQSDVNIMKSLADEYLLANLVRNNINYYYLNRAAEVIRNTNGMIRMDELIDNVYISHRQLEREFKDKIGITPKQYIRIARLNAVNRHLLKTDTADLISLSYENGFYDHAHLIREFKYFSGLAPSKFLKRASSYIVNV